MNQKIAFCFSGQARTLDQTYLFFQKNLFEAAKEQGFDYDVFCAIEDDEDGDKVQLLNPTKVEKIKSSEVEKIIEEEYGSFIQGNLRNLCIPYYPRILFLQQLYKIEKSFSLSGTKPYDIYLKLRFDVFFLNPLNFHQILETIQKGTILANHSHLKSFLFDYTSMQAIEDFYFIGNYDFAQSFCTIFQSFQKTLQNISKKTNFCSVWNKIIKIGETLNKKLKHKIFFAYPLLLLFHKLHFFVFIPEAFFYQFLLLQSFSIKKIDISTLLLRKDIEKSKIALFPKSIYEQ